MKSVVVAAAFLLANCLVLIACAHASTSGGADAQQPGYARVKASSKLKWLPYRSQASERDCPDFPGNENGTVPFRHTTSSETSAGWATAISADDSRQSPGGAFDDPFGDTQLASANETAEEVNMPLELPSAGPAGATALPSMPKNIRTFNSRTFVLQKPNQSPPRANDYASPAPQDQFTEPTFNGKSPDSTDTCPTVKDLKKISELTTNITPSAGDLPRDCPWGGEDFKVRSWPTVTFTWTASGLCHKPLYFEDVQVERYGHGWGPWAQPFASAAHFFLTVPILPYKMGLELPDECIYTLGYYRPGNCAPYMLDPLPLSIRAGLFEAGAWVAGAAIIP